MKLPAYGDLIVRQLSESPPAFVLSRYQHSTHTVPRDNVADAIRTAFGFGRNLKVDVWFHDRDDSYRPLIDPAES
jgi:hypothetical protein